MSIVKIITFVPIENADAIRQVLGDAGAGEIGEYSYCSYSVLGKGRFMPSSYANPYIGEAGKPEIVEEERIEVVCQKEKAAAVIQALRSAHPYDEVAFDVYPLLSEADI